MSEIKVVTLRDKVAEVMPEAIDDIFHGGVFSCPNAMKYHFLNVECAYENCDIYGCTKCEECWSRPFVERSE